VKADCSSILEEFGISWPEPLDCSRFPQEPDLCMNPDEDRHSYEKTSRRWYSRHFVSDHRHFPVHTICWTSTHWTTKESVPTNVEPICVFYISLCFMFYSIPYLFPVVMQYSARACDKLINGQTYLVFS
ncbi:hypothetical protein OSTOST_16697, partial [Ostertagia ostertagi]